jgi:WD40 repeat protein
MGKPVGEPLRGNTDSIFSISFSPDCIRIVTGSRDQTVRLWDAEKGKPVSEPLWGHTDSINSVLKEVGRSRGKKRINVSVHVPRQLCPNFFLRRGGYIYLAGAVRTTSINTS